MTLTIEIMLIVLATIILCFIDRRRLSFLRLGHIAVIALIIALIIFLFLGFIDAQVDRIIEAIQAAHTIAVGFFIV